GAGGGWGERLSGWTGVVHRRSRRRLTVPRMLACPDRPRACDRDQWKAAARKLRTARSYGIGSRPYAVMWSAPGTTNNFFGPRAARNTAYPCVGGTTTSEVPTITNRGWRSRPAAMTGRTRAGS